jgi:hypothetical protein
MSKTIARKIGDNFNGIIHFWDGRWFHADEKKFKSEIETVDKLNNIIIENTI